MDLKLLAVACVLSCERVSFCSAMAKPKIQVINACDRLVITTTNHIWLVYRSALYPPFLFGLPHPKTLSDHHVRYIIPFEHEIYIQQKKGERIKCRNCHSTQQTIKVVCDDEKCSCLCDMGSVGDIFRQCGDCLTDIHHTNCLWRK